MANQYTKAAKAKRVAAGRKAWITIRERRVAREFNAVASKIAIANLPQTIAESARKIALTITPSDWMRISLAVKAKIKSPVTAGSDRQSRDWRAHLRDINQAIADGEQASLNEQDWAEIYYALDATDGAESDLVAKIGPDGLNMVHPETDAHLAGCTSCMMAHDKALPDGQAGA